MVRFQRTVIDDLRKAKRLSVEKPRWSGDHLPDYVGGRARALFPTLTEVGAFIAAARGFDLSIDVETTGESPLACKLICVGMASSNGRNICVPFLRQGGHPYWSPTEGQLAWQLVCDIVADPLTPKVFHNGAFDKLVLEAFGAQVEGYFSDTIVAAHVTDSELPLGLGFCATRHLDCHYWKDDVKGAERWLDLPDEKLRLYNAKDVFNTLLLQPILEAEVRRLNLWELYQEEIALNKLMCRATVRGLLLDQERRDSTALGPDGKPIGLAPRLVLQRNAALVRLRELAGSPHFDPQKPEHLRFLFFQMLKMPVVKETKTGLPSTDKDAMVMLALLADTDQQKAVIGTLADWKVAQKKLSTWTGEQLGGAWDAEHGVHVGGVHKGGFPILSDGRLHPMWKLLTNTGRFSSQPGAQTFDSAIKKLFRAGKGRKYVGVDLSQAELRYIGYTANDRALLRMYAEDIDVHTVNMAWYFNVRYADGHKQANAKTVTYLRETVPEVNCGRTYDQLPVLPPHREKPVRTLVKNAEFGCLDGDTRVMLADVGARAIKDVRVGDTTYCWDGKAHVPTKVLRVWSTGFKPCVSVEIYRECAPLHGGLRVSFVTLTADHRMLCGDGAYVEAGKLVAGQHLMPSPNVQQAVVVAVTPALQLREVWDLEVEHPAHNFALSRLSIVANSNYRAMAETVHHVLRAKRDSETNQLLFPDLPLTQVEAILAQKMRVRTDLVAWWNRNQRETEERGYLKCPISGRVRWFRGGFKITEIANWGIQAGIASRMNKGLLEIQAIYDKETGGDCLVVQQVHDALNADASDEYAERAGEVMMEVLGRPFSLPGHPHAVLPPDPVKIAQFLDEV